MWNKPIKKLSRLFANVHLREKMFLFYIIGGVLPMLLADVYMYTSVRNVMIEQEKETEKEKKMFTPPTLAQVQAYCAGRGSPVDPQRFVDFYTANGWRLGPNPMRDWKAALRTWERRGAAAQENPFLREDV